MKFQTRTPIDNTIYVERKYSTNVDIQKTLKSAKQAQLLWSKVSIEKRVELCSKLVNHLLEKKSEIAEEICWQMGRPIQFCEGEILGFAERANYMIGIAEKKLKSVDVEHQDGFNRYIQRLPLGLVFLISPWNYPYLTAVNTIIPALMAGNVVIMKPSSQTPLTAERLFDAAQRAGLPDGVFSYLYLRHQETEILAANDLIDFVSFTGSVTGGKKIQSAMKRSFAGLGLELGGKDPAYVREDAGLTLSVESLVDGAFFNSGQSCCGIERLYVHETVYDDFVAQFVTLVKQYRLGDPSVGKATLGPMVHIKAANVVRKQIDDAIAKGAKALIDAADYTFDRKETPYVAPQVLINVDHSMTVMKKESFGPVIGIMKVSSDEEAITLMNDSEFGLTASVWTNDETAAINIGEQIHTGTWFMNRCDYLDPALAWVGVKNSGRGCTLSEMGYEQLTRPKSFHLKQFNQED